MPIYSSRKHVFERVDIIINIVNPSLLKASWNMFVITNKHTPNTEDYVHLGHTILSAEETKQIIHEVEAQTLPSGDVWYLQQMYIAFLSRRNII